MKFFLDNDVPDRIAGVLQHADYEVIRLREVLNPVAEDVTVLDHARSHDAILVTCNRDDFLALARSKEHAGIIILIRRRTRIAECTALLRLIGKAGPEGLAGNINFA